MHHRPILAGVVALAALATTPAFAQEAERYQLERSQDGYVRLDTATGAMMLCREAEGRLACVPASQGEATAENTDEIAVLRERVRRLENRLAAIESRAPAASGLPPEAEFERGLGYMERFFRMFMGLVREFQSDPQLPAPAPERT